MSSGSGDTEHLHPSIQTLTLQSDTTVDTTWCRSCRSTGTETTSSPARTSDMNIQICSMPVSPVLSYSPFTCSYRDRLPKFSVFFSLPFSDQRLVESMHPYLEELQDLWPWLLLTGVCGGVASAATAAALLMAKRRLLRLPVGRWKALLPERLPLLWDRDEDKGNYQTAF